MGIETKIAGMTRFEENNLYASTVGRESRVYGPLHYETIEVTFDMTGLKESALNGLRWQLVDKVVSYLNANGYSEAMRVNWKEVPYVGPGMNMGYILSNPEVNVPKDREEAVAVTHSGSFIPNLKFRFMVSEKPGVLARMFGKQQEKSSFYSDVKRCLYSLVAESMKKERVVEVCAA